MYVYIWTYALNVNLNILFYCPVKKASQHLDCGQCGQYFANAFCLLILKLALMDMLKWSNCFLMSVFKSIIYSLLDWGANFRCCELIYVIPVDYLWSWICEYLNLCEIFVQPMLKESYVIYKWCSCRSACAFAQSNQELYWLLARGLKMYVYCYWTV